MHWGYVGIGLMGLPMTRRLISQGHSVRVFDIEPSRMAQAREAGALLATADVDAIAELAEGVDAEAARGPGRRARAGVGVADRQREEGEGEEVVHLQRVTHRHPGKLAARDGGGGKSGHASSV